jgi:hypothetical protein
LHYAYTCPIDSFATAAATDMFDRDDQTIYSACIGEKVSYIETGD